MTAVTLDATRVPPRRTAAVAVVATAGCGALAIRPVLLAGPLRPNTVLVALFATLLAVGALLPVGRRDSPAPLRTVAAVCVLGVLAFGAGRILSGGHAPVGLTAWTVAANSLAAIAEELWFRKVCYGLLARANPVLAIAGSSVLFAAVHVSIYGVAVLPIDVAAGAVLGWQRWASGSCTAPAITHVLANLFVVL